MAKEKDKMKQIQDEITGKSREIWLAGLGVFSTMEEEGEKLFKKFVEKGRELEGKGEAFEKRAKEKVDSVTSYVSEKKEKISTAIGETFPAYIEEKLKAAIDSISASSRSQVKELADKVDKLTDKVNELIKKVDAKTKL